jgi:16S rRNA (uracil1498-N3)-methyltransferase
MQLFYKPDIAENQQFDEDESKHIVRVLRMEDGEIITLTDGKGLWAKARITNAHSKRCAFSVIESQQIPPRPYRIHLAIAPTKNIDRIEWLLEKIVEIGVDEVSFLISEHSERRQINEERLQKVAISALKQSLKAYMPVLNPMETLAKFLAKNTATHRFVAHLDENDLQNRKSLFAAAPEKSDYCVLIGPEGDFSPQEIVQAKAAGFLPVTLGESRLRTETAGLVAVTLLNFVNQK